MQNRIRVLYKRNRKEVMPVVDEIQEVLNDIGEIAITQEPIDTDINPLALDASLENTILKVNELIELAVATAEETNKGRADILRIQRAILGTLSSITTIETTNTDLVINNITRQVFLPNPTNPNNETLVKEILDSLSATDDSMQTYHMYEINGGIPVILEDSDIVDLNSKLAVLAEDGTTLVEYGMMPIYSAETDIESGIMAITVDNDTLELTITNTDAWTVGEVISHLSAIDDSTQTYQFFRELVELDGADVVTENDVLLVTSENGLATASYIVLENASSANTDIQSLMQPTFIIDNVLATISINDAIPFDGMAFKAEFSSTDATIQTYNVFNVDVEIDDVDPIVDGYILTVTAEDGLTMRDYSIAIRAASTITDIQSSEPTYVVDNTLFTLTLPTNTIESSVVLAALSSTDGSIQTIQILNGAVPIGASDPVLDTYTVSVIAEDSVTIQAYTIVIP